MCRFRFIGAPCNIDLGHTLGATIFTSYRRARESIEEWRIDDYLNRRSEKSFPRSL
jgi:hypothetical protein